MSGRAVDRARVALLAGSHAIDDIYLGVVPALSPFFIAQRHYSYAAATGLTFAAPALSSVIQPVLPGARGKDSSLIRHADAPFPGWYARSE